MGIRDIFKKRPRADLPTRLGNIAVANTAIRGGQAAEQLYLAVNLDAERKVTGDRPAMAFQFDVEQTGDDRWRLAARIDGATSYCRFWIDLELRDQPPLDPATFDPSAAPTFRITVSKPPDHERSPLARGAFLLAWRVDGGIELESHEVPLALDATVMGVDLSRLPHAYVPGGQDHWALLKCSRGDQSFWLGLHLSTGAAEVFPRRGELPSYELALDFVRTFT